MRHQLPPRFWHVATIIAQIILVGIGLVAIAGAAFIAVTVWIVFSMVPR